MNNTWNVRIRASAIFLWFAWVAFAQSDAENYVRKVQKLDESRPESVCVARDSLRSLIDAADLDGRAQMFRAFRSFYLRAVMSTTQPFFVIMNRYVGDHEDWVQAHPSNDSTQEFLLQRPDIAKAGDAWFHCGFLMNEAEGDLYPAENPATLLEFAGKLPPGLTKYVRFRAKEDATPFLADACLLISWEQLRERVARWESFSKDYPNLLETNSEAKPQLAALAHLYLFGVDNTATFDFNTGRLEPALVESWRVFAARDKNSQYHALISSLLADVESRNLMMDQQHDRPLFERAGMAREFDQWWALWQLRAQERAGELH